MIRMGEFQAFQKIWVYLMTWFRYACILPRIDGLNPHFPHMAQHCFVGNENLRSSVAGPPGNPGRKTACAVNTVKLATVCRFHGHPSDGFTGKADIPPPVAGCTLTDSPVFCLPRRLSHSRLLKQFVHLEYIIQLFIFFPILWVPEFFQDLF